MCVIGFVAQVASLLILLAMAAAASLTGTSGMLLAAAIADGFYQVATSFENTYCKLMRFADSDSYITFIRRDAGRVAMVLPETLGAAAAYYYSDGT